MVAVNRIFSVVLSALILICLGIVIWGRSPEAATCDLDDPAKCDVGATSAAVLIEQPVQQSFMEVSDTTVVNTTTTLFDLQKDQCDDEPPVTLPVSVLESRFLWDGPQLSGKILAIEVDEQLTNIMVVDLSELKITTYAYNPSFLYSDALYYREDISFTPNGEVIAVSGYDCLAYLFSDFHTEPSAFPIYQQYPYAVARADGERIWITQRSGPSDLDSTLVDGFEVGTGRNFFREQLENPYRVEAVVGNKLLMVSENERIILESVLTKRFLRCNIYNLSICPEVVGVNDQELIALAYYETIPLYFTGPGYKAGPEEYDYQINEIIVSDMRTKKYLHTVEKPGVGYWSSARVLHDGPIYAADAFLTLFLPDRGDYWSLYRVHVTSGTVEHIATVDNRIIPSDFPQRNYRVWLTAEDEALYADGSTISLLDGEDGSLRKVVSLPEGFQVWDAWAGGSPGKGFVASSG